VGVDVDVDVAMDGHGHWRWQRTVQFSAVHRDRSITSTEYRH
jgi:hypothetical protein